MTANRVFFPQEALGAWLEEERIELDGEYMTLNPDGQRFKICSALRILSEVAEGSDPHGLVGKVKTLEAIGELGGEHYADSVLLGDNAYEVVEGFLGEPQHDDAAQAAGHSLASATRAAMGEKTSSDDIDPLTRFFMGT